MSRSLDLNAKSLFTSSNTSATPSLLAGGPTRIIENCIMKHACAQDLDPKVVNNRSDLYRGSGSFWIPCPNHAVVRFHPASPQSLANILIAISKVPSGSGQRYRGSRTSCVGTHVGEKKNTFDQISDKRTTPTLLQTVFRFGPEIVETHLLPTSLLKLSGAPQN